MAVPRTAVRPRRRGRRGASGGLFRTASELRLSLRRLLALDALRDAVRRRAGLSVAQGYGDILSFYNFASHLAY